MISVIFLLVAALRLRYCQKTRVLIFVVQLSHSPFPMRVVKKQITNHKYIFFYRPEMNYYSAIPTRTVYSL